MVNANGVSVESKKMVAVGGGKVMRDGGDRIFEQMELPVVGLNSIFFLHWKLNRLDFHFVTKLCFVL